MAWLTPDPVALHARGQPGRHAAWDIATGRRWSYAALDIDIRRAVTWLARVGDIRPGQRVAVVAANNVDQILLMIALARMGAIFVPLNHRLATAELAVILADCRPQLLITDRLQAMPEGLDDITQIDMDTAAAGIRTCQASAQAPACDPEAVQILLYTSGTSGTPKGVMITGQNIHATAVNFGLLGRVAHDSVFLCDAPMFHVIGLLPSVHAPLLYGAALAIAPGFEPERTNRLLADPAVGVSHYFCVPQMAERLATAPGFTPERWQRLSALFTGGSPLAPACVHEWLARGVLLSNGYGMTEAGTLLHVPLEPDTVAATAGSVGLPPPQVGIRLVDAQGGDVVAGTPGEILVCGPNVTPGYWQRPEATAAVFTTDGWLHTGDIGRADDNGFITLVDRSKDMYISGGENVYPAEVEQVLIAHPDVVEAAVVGMPDAHWGEVGRAHVVLVEGARLSDEALIRHCRAHLAGYKVPRQIEIKTALPRNAAGKLLKQVLRQR